MCVVSDLASIGIPRTAGYIDNSESVAFGRRFKDIHEQSRAMRFAEDNILLLNISGRFDSLNVPS